MTSALEQVLQEFLHNEADRIPRTAGTPYERLFGPPHQLIERHRRRLIGPIAAAAAVIVVATSAVIVSGSHHGNTTNPVDVGQSIPAEISVPATVLSILDHPMPRAGLLIQTGTDSEPNAVSSDPILVSPDGHTYRTLPTIGDGAAPGTVSLSAFAPSADGTRVAYGDWTRTAPGSSALHVVDLASGQVSTFAMPGSGNGEQITNVTWSPDGTRIAYSAASITELPLTSPVRGKQHRTTRFSTLPPAATLLCRRLHTLGPQMDSNSWSARRTRPAPCIPKPIRSKSSTALGKQCAQFQPVR